MSLDPAPTHAQPTIPRLATKLPTILITGGTGFVGSAIVRALLSQHPETHVTILDLHIDHTQISYRGLVDSRITIVKANILDQSQLDLIFSRTRPDAIVHTAGFVPPLEYRYDPPGKRRMEQVCERVNVEGTKVVLEAARRCGTAQGFLYTCTCCVVIDDWSGRYENIDERWPVTERGKGSTYGESKAFAEEIVLGANNVSLKGLGSEKNTEEISGKGGKVSMKTCSLRPATTYGEHDHQLMPSIISCIINKWVPESVFQIGDGNNLWDTVYVGNVADAHVLALENLLATDKELLNIGKESAAGEAFLIQNNAPTTFREFCIALWKAYNGHIPPFTVVIPVFLAMVLGVVAEFFTWLAGSPATFSRGSMADATAVRYASGEKARRILGYEAQYGLEESLKRSCAEYRGRRERTERAEKKGRKGRAGHPKSNTEVVIQALGKSLFAKNIG